MVGQYRQGSSTESCLKRVDCRITRNYTCRQRRAGSVKTDFKAEKVLEFTLFLENITFSFLAFGIRLYWFCNLKRLPKKIRLLRRLSQDSATVYNSVHSLFLELAILFYLQKMLSLDRLYFVILLLYSVLVLSNKTTHGVRCSLRCAKPKLRQGEIYSKCHVSYPLKLNCSAEEISLQLQNVSFL